ncbi:hypothetical protein JCM15548_14797 [Geofilum rubicundum JCM 15548]|uniref:SH3b domain-containing protein n=2 Tax=Geofilum TaxID=1236988 RepID=A0A0E9LRR1_9BACT|nr:hypothetical protein JCM15548_14797 [Geofilum rubicundum JCM 15548]
MKTLQLIILICLMGLIPIKSQELGYINDSDGYSNLRLEPSDESDIIGIILKGQEFDFYPDISSDWWKVSFKFRTGFMHRSRIKDFDRVKAEIGQFFHAFYSTDRNNVELGEGFNEKLFLLTQDYPLAALTSFCEQRKEIQVFLISEYESPIHDLLDLQLIYSRLISVNSTCSEAYRIADALKRAANNIGIELKNIKSFIDSIPDFNRPDKHKGTSNIWFTSSINGKSITFYLNHPQIDTYSKMFYQGQLGLMDDALTFSILDSLLTNNSVTRPFYIHTFNSALRIADGALAESIGTQCQQFMDKYPCEFISLKSKKEYSDNYNKWIDLAAFEYYFDENAIEKITIKYESLKGRCNVPDSEFDYIEDRLIEFIKENE